jgi:hypothetical protein
MAFDYLNDSPSLERFFKRGFKEQSLRDVSSRVHRHFSPEGRADLTASAVLQRIRGGRTTASCAAPCFYGNLGS